MRRRVVGQREHRLRDVRVAVESEARADRAERARVVVHVGDVVAGAAEDLEPAADGLDVDDVVAGARPRGVAEVGAFDGERVGLQLVVGQAQVDQLEVLVLDAVEGLVVDRAGAQAEAHQVVAAQRALVHRAHAGCA